MVGLTDAEQEGRTMLRTYGSRVAAGAVISAALTVGALSLAATTASSGGRVNVAFDCPGTIAVPTSSGGGSGPGGTTTTC
jgi:hypothetical protein